MKGETYTAEVQPGDSVILAKGDRMELSWTPSRRLLGRLKYVFRPSKSMERIVVELTDINITGGIPMARLDVLETGI